MTIRVAHVNVTRGYRGGERQTELLIRGLAERGVGQQLIARRGEPLARRIEALGIRVVRVSGNPFAVAAVSGGADLVHLHEGRSVYAGYLRSLLSGTPYVATRRVDNPIGEHRLAHLAYRRASRVVAVAPQVAEIVMRFDARVRTEVIHSSSSRLAVDPIASAEIRSAFPGKTLIGHVGALDNRQKGQEFIIEVARNVLTSHPQLQFLLVGGGDDEAILRKAAAGLSNVTFTGFVNNVGDYLAAFDLFILPSRKEGIGSILLDAMERRLPIIAARVGGVPEIVYDGENGLLIAPERPAELQAAILRLLASPETCRRFGDAGHQLAKKFTADVMCDKYLALYHAVLDEKKPRAAGAGKLRALQ